MSGDDRFDNLFMTVAQQAQGIEPLLDQLFGFLRRKTDFYTAPPDKIHSMVVGALKKQGEVYDQEQARKAAAKEKEDKRKKAAAAKKKADQDAKAAAAAAATANSTPAPAAASEEGDVLELTGDGDFDASGVPPPSNLDKNGDESAAAGEEEEEDNTPPPPGNGGSTDKYSWTQTLAEVTVTAPLPAGIKAKMLNVDIKKNSLRVSIKGENAPIIDGTFHKSVFLDDSIWNVVDGSLVLDLCKDNRMEWWKCVLQGDPEINTQKKVQPENSKLSDLDGETRQTVEKMMFDQRQKAQGLPSSEELQKQNMMKKFMDAHPEMDFSKAKFN
eukprot:GSChrysophyteH1.ASY1.ANO1.1378.1 assembled CDS